MILFFLSAAAELTLVISDKSEIKLLFHSEQHTIWFYFYFLLEVLHVWSNCSSVRVRWVPLILNSHDLPMFVLHGPCRHWLPVTVCSVFTWLQWNLHTEDKLDNTNSQKKHDTSNRNYTNILKSLKLSHVIWLKAEIKQQFYILIIHYSILNVLQR